MNVNDVMLQAALDAVQVAQMRGFTVWGEGGEQSHLDRVEDALLEVTGVDYDENGNKVGGPTGKDRLSFVLALQSLCYFADEVQMTGAEACLRTAMQAAIDALPHEEVSLLNEIWGGGAMPDPQE